MTNTEILLTSIGRAAEMGRFSVEKLLGEVKGEPFRNILVNHKQQYSRIFLSADTLLKSSGSDDSGLSAFSKVMGGAAMDLNLIADRSDGHIAEMLIKGTDEAIEEMEKQLCICADAEQNVQKLAHSFLDFLKSSKIQLAAFKND